MNRDRAAMMRSFVAFSSGLLFGTGLIVGGMTKPTKVLGFLDVFGAWDATLLFVMIGAIAVHSVAYAIVRRKRSPLLASAFRLPTRRDIDAELLLGAVVFGVGWGLAGYCPGPSVVSVASGRAGVVLFVITMSAGLYGGAKLQSAIERVKVRSAGGSSAAVRS